MNKLSCLWFLTVVILASCSGSKKQDFLENGQFYEQGMKDAQEILEAAQDQDQVQELLLERQAKISEYTVKYSPQDAQRYKDGIEARIIQDNDSLAREMGL